ncbi:uncharacterized protein LOC130912099 [Corythoichthys intestinalis]|uniref:uncharacterized protein LOC130912099 n=1 Tax=Corythoichthys intestinalis TaxID=161448 RepID=UPI0025A4D52D|nr:uncharacterized protein LOC130912099 [Corythoichthys intestinalis]
MPPPTTPAPTTAHPAGPPATAATLQQSQHTAGFPRSTRPGAGQGRLPRVGDTPMTHQHPARDPHQSPRRIPGQIREGKAETGEREAANSSSNLIFKADFTLLLASVQIGSKRDESLDKRWACPSHRTLSVSGGLWPQKVRGVWLQPASLSTLRRSSQYPSRRQEMTQHRSSQSPQTGNVVNPCDENKLRYFTSREKNTFECCHMIQIGQAARSPPHWEETKSRPPNGSLPMQIQGCHTDPNGNIEHCKTHCADRTNGDNIRPCRASWTVQTHPAQERLKTLTVNQQGDMEREDWK